jgi:hypothetical protein
MGDLVWLPAPGSLQASPAVGVDAVLPCFSTIGRCFIQFAVLLQQEQPTILEQQSLVFFLVIFFFFCFATGMELLPGWWACFAAADSGHSGSVLNGCHDNKLAALAEVQPTGRAAAGGSRVWSQQCDTAAARAASSTRRSQQQHDRGKPAGPGAAAACGWCCTVRLGGSRRLQQPWLQQPQWTFRGAAGGGQKLHMRRLQDSTILQ